VTSAKIDKIFWKIFEETLITLIIWTNFLQIFSYPHFRFWEIVCRWWCRLLKSGSEWAKKEYQPVLYNFSCWNIAVIGQEQCRDFFYCRFTQIAGLTPEFLSYFWGLTSITGLLPLGKIIFDERSYSIIILLNGGEQLYILRGMKIPRIRGFPWIFPQDGFLTSLCVIINSWKKGFIESSKNATKIKLYMYMMYTCSWPMFI
jgi:hypothetical protein